jgi:hypothetical protein
MIRYRTLGSGALEQLRQLAELLTQHGATETGDLMSELVLLGADNVADASAILEQLDPFIRSNVVLVGVPGELDVRRRAAQGTLAGLLEMYRPLGAIEMRKTWSPVLSGFIGKKDLADRMESGVAKEFSTQHYGNWLRCDGSDAADFLLRLLAARASSAASDLEDGTRT